MLQVRRILFCSVVICSVVCASSAFATTVIRIDLEKMTRSSAVVLQGEVTAVRTIAVRGNERNIRTDVTVRVDQLLKGSKNLKQVTLKLPGGRLGKWEMRIPGMPAFTHGERVVLFLEKTATNWALTGLSQAKFSIVTGKDGIERVHRRFDSLNFVDFNKAGRMQAVSPPQDKGQLLGALLTQIRAIHQRSQTVK
jgi:hypothetical protein